MLISRVDPGRDVLMQRFSRLGARSSRWHNPRDAQTTTFFMSVNNCVRVPQSSRDRSLAWVNVIGGFQLCISVGKRNGRLQPRPRLCRTNPATIPQATAIQVDGSGTGETPPGSAE